MQSPTTRTCQYCAKRPADQTLFTTFMRCGEGSATKRNATCANGARQHAMLVLDSMGMVVAFKDDGQIDWDAHVTLSENATRSLARRARQREDLLVQLEDPSAPIRAHAPTRPEEHSILHQLAAEGLIESTVDRGREFRPEDTCRLTRKGNEAAACIRKRRTAETGGLPIDEWSPLYVPEQGTEEEFREYADQPMISPHGDLYDASPYLMLRHSDGGSAGKERSTQKTYLVFDEGIWTTRPVRPIGYFSFKNISAIAFDADNVQVARRGLRTHPGDCRTRRPVDGHGTDAREPDVHGRTGSENAQGRHSRSEDRSLRLHLHAARRTAGHPAVAENTRASRTAIRRYAHAACGPARRNRGASTVLPTPA